MDVAALNLSIDSSDVVKATADLDKFTASSNKAAAAGAKLSGGGGNTAKLAGDYARAAQAADRASGAVARAAQAVNAANAHVVTYRNHLQGIVAASGQAAAAQTNLATAVARTSVATQQADGHVVAYRSHLERLVATNKAAASSGGTAATGVAAVGVAGKTTGAIVSGLAGIFGGLVGVLIGSVISALIDVVAGLFETDNAMKAVELGADSLGDAQGVLGKMFDLTTGKIKSQNEMLILNARLTALNMRAEAAAQKANFDSTVGGFRDGSSGVGFGTKALGFLGFDVSGSYGREQGVAAITKGLKDGSLTREQALQRTEKLDFSGLNATKQEFQQAIIDGAAAELKVKAADLIDQSLNSGVLASEFREPGAAARAARGRRGGGGKSDAEKIADIVRTANAEIAAEQNRTKAVQMSAEAAAELEQRTKLLNAAASAGLTITPALTQQIEKLSAAYADAKVAADVAEATKSATEEIDRQRAAIADEIKLIGLRGEALARARREMEAQKKLADSLPRGAIAVTGTLTAGLSDDIEAQDRQDRIAKIQQASEDAAFAMKLEAGAIGLSGKALIAYNYAAEKRLENQRLGIAAGPEEVAVINAAAIAYAEQRYAIDQQAQALADAREVAGGFFSDWINGVREGGNLFKTFADSVINGLNRIIDKLMDKAFDSLFSGNGFLGNILGSVAGGGLSSTNSSGGAKATFKNALGNAFHSGVMRFAKGGSFTNQIVNSPTLFKFAKGAAIGEMGEAGPEAVMPLTRGPNGELGVQAHGGGGRPTIKMGDVTNVYKVEGGFMPDAVLALIRQGGVATYDQMKRDLQSLLQQLDTDGAFAT